MVGDAASEGPPILFNSDISKLKSQIYPAPASRRLAIGRAPATPSCLSGFLPPFVARQEKSRAGVPIPGAPGNRERAGSVAGPNGEAVHSRARKRREIDSRQSRLPEHASRRNGNFHGLRREQSSPLQNACERILDRQEARHRRARATGDRARERWRGPAQDSSSSRSQYFPTPRRSGRRPVRTALV